MVTLSLHRYCGTFRIALSAGIAKAIDEYMYYNVIHTRELAKCLLFLPMYVKLRQ